MRGRTWRWGSPSCGVRGSSEAPATLRSRRSGKRSRAGTLRFADLWAQHNEHRLLLPNLVMLALAQLTQWDTRATIVASFVVSLATLGVLGLIIRSTLGRSAPAIAGWVFLGVSLM